MINKKEVFKNHAPSAIYFDEDNLDRLFEYLGEKGIINKDEILIRTEKPGAGNMNFVIRVVTDKRSIILKQSRPWVEKYPQIQAPAERINVEASYYHFIKNMPFFHGYSPDVILFDPENLILILEDLGKGTDFTFSYNKSEIIHEDQLSSLISYISKLHHCDWTQPKDQFPSNRKLKRLNHEHIFQFPYMEENGFDLDSIQQGLHARSLPIKRDQVLKEKIRELGKKYLESGPVLIHGDYYPGSWLQVDGEVKVIDPEFAYFGYAEFDLAVMAAHLFMSGMNIHAVSRALQEYEKRYDFDEKLFVQFCGVELLRRIIGLAQLPLYLTLKEKSELIDLAISFVNSPKTHKFL